MNFIIIVGKITENLNMEITDLFGKGGGGGLWCLMLILTNIQIAEITAKFFFLTYHII